MIVTPLSFNKATGDLTFSWSMPHPHTKYVWNLWNETRNQNWRDNSAVRGAIKGTGSGWSGAYYVGPGGPPGVASGTATFTGVDPSGIYADEAYSFRLALPDEGGGVGNEPHFSGAELLALPDPSAAAAPPARATAPTPQAPLSPVTPPVASLPLTAGGGFTYTPPNPEPAAIDGARLSQQGLDVQDFYVSNFGPGILAATQFVIDHNQQLAALGSTSGNTPTAGTTLATLPAGVSGMGNDVGLIGGGGNFSSTPGVLNQRQTGAAPPPVSGSPLSQSVAGIPVWAIAAAAAAFVLSNRR